MADSPPQPPLSTEALRAARLSYFVRPPTPPSDRGASPVDPASAPSSFISAAPAFAQTSALAIPTIIVHASDSDSAPASPQWTQAMQTSFEFHTAASVASMHAAFATRPAAAPPFVSDLASYTTESLPISFRQFKKTEFKKYRDAVCGVLQLSFKPIEGKGNCFFESVSTLLQRAA